MDHLEKELIYFVPFLLAKVFIFKAPHQGEQETYTE